MERKYNLTTQNQFNPDMSNVTKCTTVEAKLISLGLRCMRFHKLHCCFRFKSWKQMKHMYGVSMESMVSVAKDALTGTVVDVSILANCV